MSDLETLRGDAEVTLIRRIRDLEGVVEKLTSGQHDIYVAAREEYRKKIAEQAAENEKLRAALRESAAELDAYYRAEYLGEYPYSKRKLAEALAANPARAALEERQ